MKSARKIFFLSLCIVFLLVGFLIITNQKAKEGNIAERKIVNVKGVEISVEIADTADKKAKGLSGRKSLDKGSGMLFIFPKDTEPAFWMKDMFFPIDIIWINDDKITQIDKNVTNPTSGTDDSQLPLYRPSLPIDYVLEVNAGFSDKNNFEVGDPIDLSSI